MASVRLKELPLPPSGKFGWPWTEESDQSPETTSDGLPWPRLSVVTPSLNQGEFIEETIRSVILQGYLNLEYLVFDGGSTDGTVDIIRKYAPWIDYWVSEPDEGQSEAINMGWEMSTGEILAWLNSDDKYTMNALNRVGGIFARNSTALTLTGSCDIADVNGTDITKRMPPHSFDPEPLLANAGQPPGQPSVFIRREVFDGIGKLDTSLHYVMDWEYWIRIGMMYPPQSVITCSDALSVVRRWDGTKTSRGGVVRVHEILRVMDNVFGASEDLGDLNRVRRQSYYSAYLKLASAQLQEGAYLGGLYSVLNALRLAPRSFVSHLLMQKVFKKLKRSLSALTAWGHR